MNENKGPISKSYVSEGRLSQSEQLNSGNVKFKNDLMHPRFETYLHNISEINGPCFRCPNIS